MNDSKQAHEFAAKLERVYFVYDRKSGNVLGFHPVWTVRGGTLPKNADLERSIRSSASRLLKGRLRRSGIAFVTGRDFDPARTYRFDMRAKRLVATARRREAQASRSKGAIAAGKPPPGPEQIWF
jgi:hypothetical protein